MSNSTPVSASVTAASAMAPSWINTSAALGRLSGSPSQQLWISSRHLAGTEAGMVGRAPSRAARVAASAAGTPSYGMPLVASSQNTMPRL